MPELRARTLLEARLYAKLAGLSDGTEGGENPAGMPVEGPDAWTFRFGDVGITVPYESEAEARREGERFGVGPSQLIDAGQWKLLGAGYARQVLELDLAFTEEPGDGSAYDDIVLGWQLAIDATGEVLKFIPPGEDEVPDHAFWTETGRRAREEEPGRFTRAVIEEDIDFYRNNLDDFRRMNR